MKKRTEAWTLCCIQPCLCGKQWPMHVCVCMLVHCSECCNWTFIAISTPLSVSSTLSADQDGFLLFLFLFFIFALILLWRNGSQAVEIHNAHHRECDHFVRHGNGCNVVLDFGLTCLLAAHFIFSCASSGQWPACYIKYVKCISLSPASLCPTDSVLCSFLLYVVQSLQLRIHCPIRCF